MVSFTKKELVKETSNKIHVIYHSKDSDGRCGGGVIRYYCEEVLNKEPNMIPFNHGEPMTFIDKIEDSDTVYMVDISLPLAEMTDLNKRTKLIWFDHHKTSIEQNKELNIVGETDSNRAGCGIAFDYLLKDKINKNVKSDVVKLITLISDYDNWNVSKYGDVEYKNTPSAVNIYLSSINVNPSSDDGYNNWKELFSKGTINKGDNLNQMLTKGRFLQSYQDKKNAGAVKSDAFEIKFEGKNAIMCFGVHGSQSFDAVYDESKHDMMIAVSVDKTKKYNISFYSTKKNVDVSIIAKKYGGGGHFGASGCNCSTIDFSGDTLIIN